MYDGREFPLLLQNANKYRQTHHIPDHNDGKLYITWWDCFIRIQYWTDDPDEEPGGLNYLHFCFHLHVIYNPILHFCERQKIYKTYSHKVWQVWLWYMYEKWHALFVFLSAGTLIVKILEKKSFNCVFEAVLENTQKYQEVS